MLPYDFNTFKKEFIKKKTPEKEIDPPPIVDIKNNNMLIAENAGEVIVE